MAPPCQVIGCVLWTLTGRSGEYGRVSPKRSAHSGMSPRRIVTVASVTRELERSIRLGSVIGNPLVRDGVPSTSIAGDPGCVNCDDGHALHCVVTEWIRSSLVGVQLGCVRDTLAFCVCQTGPRMASVQPASLETCFHVGRRSNIGMQYVHVSGYAEPTLLTIPRDAEVPRLGITPS